MAAVRVMRGHFDVERVRADFPVLA
ncbi:MAG: hypothetical protein HW392_695, partial [Steroidobacteraceae bacterium]|nr:hypothetical protein [Steroidobacteraceae bacterium]